MENSSAFWDKINKPSVKQLKEQLLKFVQDEVKPTHTVKQQQMLLNGFIAIYEENMRKNPLWSNLNEDDFLNECEQVETFICTKLFDILFFGNKIEEQQNAEFSEKLDQLSWIKPEYLDIEHVDEENLQCAIQELQKINEYKTPKHKITCIANTFRIINVVLQICRKGMGTFGADVSLPVFIFVVLKARPKNLLRNFKFMRKFRYKPRRDLTDALEFRYSLSNLEIAIGFLQNITEKDLKLPPHIKYDELVPTKNKSVGIQTTLSSLNPDLIDLSEDKTELISFEPEINGKELNSFPKFKGSLEIQYLLSNQQALQDLIEDHHYLLTKFVNPY